MLVKVLFYIIKKSNKTLTFSLNFLRYKDCMIASKSLFDRAKSRR